MAARAMWKGVIRFGDVAVPVKLYSAVEDHRVHFRLLHADDLVPVEQQMIHPTEREPVAAGDIQRGYRAAEGRYVTFSDDELEALAPPASRDIEITRFVAPSAISPMWYERPYYLGPDGDDDAYFALAAALADRELEGVARWTMRKIRYLGALRASGGYLILHKLRFADDVVLVPEIDVPEHSAPSEAELTMAARLMSALEGEFDPGALRSDYRRRVRALIQAKAEGEVAHIEEYHPRRPDASLTRALEQSLRAVRAANG